MVIINMKRILQIVPKLEIGGVERTTIQTAKILKKNRMIPFVISSGGKMVKNLENENIQHIKLWVNSKNPLIILINAIIIAIIIFIKKIDVIHVRSRAPAWSAWLASKLTGKKLITTFHGLYSGYNNCIKNKYNSIMTKGSKIIVSTNFMKEHILKYYKINKNNIVIIPRGVDIDKFKNLSIKRLEIMKKKYNINNEYVVTLPGRLTDLKGHFTFLNAIKILDDNSIKYLIIGKGNKNYSNKLKKFINENNLNVIIDENCEDIPAIYNISNIILSCSTQEETFGRVAVEGMASGKCVIATNIGGSKETIINNHTGFLINSKDPIILAKTIKLIKNEKIKINKNDIIKQSEKFSLDIFEKNIIKFYKNLQ